MSKITPRTQRSRPGAGERVQLYVVNEAAIDRGYEPADVLCYTPDAEDFAVCGWPVVVKAKAHVTRRQLVRHLLYLASVLESWSDDG